MFERYELQPMEDGSFTIILHLKRNLEEFAAEPGQRIKIEGKHRQTLENEVKEYVRERFPNSKVTRAKVMLGTAVVAAIPLLGATAAPAAFATGTDTGVASASTADTTGAQPGTTTATEGNATGDSGTTTTGGPTAMNSTDSSETAETSGTDTTATAGTTDTTTAQGSDTNTSNTGATGTTEDMTGTAGGGASAGAGTATETGTTGTDTATGTDNGTTGGDTTGTPGTTTEATGDTTGTTGTSTGAQRTLTDLGNSYASNEIAELVRAGVLTGYEDNTFRPSAEMTREEFATGLAKAAGLDVDMNAKSNFTDVSDWAQPYVAAVIKAGFMVGEEQNSFGGGHQVTREQMVTTFMRALGQPNLADTYTNQTSTFVDTADMSDYAKPNIALAQQLGFVVGMSAGDGKYKFDPQAHAERQAIALLLHKFYNNHTALAAQAAALVQGPDTPTGDPTTGTTGT
ncbi:S-layer homology domain-containing protein [Tumebacillus flagellatus]|uniref:SLH domain-containing protein n=1 Tax=Tumebacillus flagellatus TaxID=1157490 RepID=A0A074M7D4_9BACL|nr:S-layer homology domain-containing protein [Tumebacillus flagellatus]KEO81922.1 hypothetical protein EL26_18000 [Tumebacillus flagellatus]